MQNILAFVIVVLVVGGAIIIPIISFMRRRKMSFEGVVIDKNTVKVKNNAFFILK